MRVHIYEVQKGDKVLPQFVGTKVSLQNADTPDEAIAAGHFADLSAIMAAANRDRNIVANRAVRAALSKLQDGESAETAIQRAIKAGNAVKVGGPRAAGTPKTAKAKTVVKNTAASVGNRLFEKMLANPTFREQAFEGGFADKGEYEAWRAAKAKAAVEAAAPKAEATPTQGNGAQPAQAPAAPAQPQVQRRPQGAKK